VFFSAAYCQQKSESFYSNVNQNLWLSCSNSSKGFHSGVLIVLQYATNLFVSGPLHLLYNLLWILFLEILAILIFSPLYSLCSNAPLIWGFPPKVVSFVCYVLSIHITLGTLSIYFRCFFPPEHKTHNDSHFMVFIAVSQARSKHSVVIDDWANVSGIAETFQSWAMKLKGRERLVLLA
jgi:hypothetical protein